MKIFTAIIFFTLSISVTGFSQRVPNESENIDYLVTFGQDAPPNTGDDDHVQIIFFVVPYSFKEPVYLRIFDPDMGNKHDEFVGAPDTFTRFSVFGGKGAFSSKEARETTLNADYKTGNQLASQVFCNNA